MSSSDGDAGAGGIVNLLLVLEPDPELDPEACERLTRQLRAELAELDVESVGLAAAVPCRMARRAPTPSR